MKIEKKEIILSEKTYQVLIQRKKIKHTYIRINDFNQIMVSTNSITPYASIKALIYKNEARILKMLKDRKNNELEDNKIYYLGSVYDYSIKEANRFHYEIESQRVLFYTPYSIEETIDLFYKEEAKKLYPERLNLCYEHFTNAYKIKMPDLVIRQMKRRLGTCYFGKNKICLNTHNIKYSIETIDYVIYHELTHFIHPNHSKSFYALLDNLRPNHRNIRKNLNK